MGLLSSLRPRPGHRFPALAMLLAVLGCTGAEEAARQPAQAAPAEHTSPAAEAPLVDDTPSSGPKFTHFNGMTGELYFCEMVGPGGAFADIDGDGDLDALLLQGTVLGEGEKPEDSLLPPRHPLPLRDRLYRNDLELSPDGRATARFVDITEQSGLDSRGYGMGVASGDIDNDGDVDFYIANFGPNRLLRNRGDGTFEDVTESSGSDDRRWSVSALFTDIDGDGWLDLFIANYVDYSIATHKRCRAATGAPDYCGPHSYPPQTDRLLRNRGDGTFEDVTSRLGLDAAAGGGLGVVDADFDLDGRVDLYVANDGSANHLWTRQDAGTFTDQALLRGAALNRDGHAEAGMGVDAGDFDNDGDEDIFLSHLTQETNTLYENLGDATFDDTTSVIGLGAPSFEGTGFGTGFLDFDNDGWLDVLVVNGAVKILDALRRQGEIHPLHQQNQLYRNRGDGSFVEVSGGAAFEPSHTSRGAVFGDVDNDGDMDVLVLNNGGPARLLRNRLDGAVPWLGLRLLSREGRDLIGSRVKLERTGAPPLYRSARTGGSYASARDPRVLFGLGGGAGASAAVITWPDGRRERFPISDINRYLVLRPGEGEPLP